MVALSKYTTATKLSSTSTVPDFASLADEARPGYIHLYIIIDEDGYYL